MSGPYLLERPAIVAFSGGRTSAFMLRQIIDAFGGSLPEDVIPCFQNTGLEHCGTYTFIREVEERWSVPIKWLEYRRVEDGPSFVEVRPETASRNGEPFDALIDSRRFLPNPVTRFCTSELKIRTAYRFTKSLGWDEFTMALGLRADEPRRVAKLKGDRAAEHVTAPMSAAGHTVEDVRAFWAAQTFDLRLPNDDAAFGNCVGCFLKSRARLQRVARAEPSALDWWIRQEAKGWQGPTGERGSGGHFRNDRPSYAAQLEEAKNQGVMFEDDLEPCFCTD